MNYKKVMVHLLILSICNYTCSSHSMKMSSQDFKEKFKPGDKVNVKTKDGPRYKFILTEEREDSIKGNEYTVATKDIISIEKIQDDINYDIIFKILIVIGVIILIANGIGKSTGPH